MVRRASDFALIYVAIVLLLLFVATIVPALFLLRWIAGAALVLILPGYAWTAALFVDNELSGLRKLWLSLGLSISIAIVVGLLLNLTPWGLSQLTWLVALSAISLLGVMVEVPRRMRLLQYDTNQSLWVPRDAIRALLGSRLNGVLLVTAALLVAAAFSVAFVSASSTTSNTQVVQFWMIPATGQSQSSPSQLQIGVRVIGPASSLSFEVAIRENGKVISTTKPFRVQPGKDWLNVVHLPKLPAKTLVEADLYRTSDLGIIYRSVWIYT